MTSSPLQMMRATATIALLLVASGCGRDAAVPPAAVAPTVDIERLEPLQIQTTAPTLNDTHPSLASAGLVHARLLELPDGVLLRSESFIIQQDDLEQELLRAPEAMRDELRRQSFYVLEQMATRDLLAAEAQMEGMPGTDDGARIQALIERESESVTVTDEEVRGFYEANKEMTGGMPFEQIADQLKTYVLQEKQQEKVNQFAQDLANRIPVAVSSSWTAEQAAAAKNNPIDQARASGQPTMVSFGADKCMPCRAMAPAREAVAKKYEGHANVVYIRVDQEQVLSSRYGVRGIPHLIFFDADGNEVFAHTGMMSQEEMETQFARLGVML